MRFVMIAGQGFVSSSGHVLTEASACDHRCAIVFKMRLNGDHSVLCAFGRASVGGFRMIVAVTRSPSKAGQLSRC